MNLLEEQRERMRKQEEEDRECRQKIAEQEHAWRDKQAESDRIWRQEDVQLANNSMRANYRIAILAAAIGAVATLAAVAMARWLAI